METLTLEQAYYIGELIAAIAVIISLIYVGRQVKQNTDATQISAAQAFVEMYNTITDNIATSSEQADLWYRGSEDYGGLSRGEAIQFSAMLFQWYRIFESAYHQYRRGALDPDFWVGLENQLIDTEMSPGIQEWKKLRGRWYGPGFWQYVDSLKQTRESKYMYAHIDKG